MSTLLMACFGFAVVLLHWLWKPRYVFLQQAAKSLLRLQIAITLACAVLTFCDGPRALTLFPLYATSMGVSFTIMLYHFRTCFVTVYTAGVSYALLSLCYGVVVPVFLRLILAHHPLAIFLTGVAVATFLPSDVSSDLRDTCTFRAYRAQHQAIVTEIGGESAKGRCIFKPSADASDERSAEEDTEGALSVVSRLWLPAVMCLISGAALIGLLALTAALTDRQHMLQFLILPASGFESLIYVLFLAVPAAFFTQALISAQNGRRACRWVALLIALAADLTAGLLVWLRPDICVLECPVALTLFAQFLWTLRLREDPKDALAEAHLAGTMFATCVLTASYFFLVIYNDPHA